jgi:hypothetical protein
VDFELAAWFAELFNVCAALGLAHPFANVISRSDEVAILEKRKAAPNDSFSN